MLGKMKQKMTPREGGGRHSGHEESSSEIDATVTIRTKSGRERVTQGESDFGLGC